MSISTNCGRLFGAESRVVIWNDERQWKVPESYCTGHIPKRSSSRTINSARQSPYSFAGINASLHRIASDSRFTAQLGSPLQVVVSRAVVTAIALAQGAQVTARPPPSQFSKVRQTDGDIRVQAFPSGLSTTA